MRTITLCGGLVLGLQLSAAAQTPVANRPAALAWWQNPKAAAAPLVRRGTNSLRPGRAVRHSWDAGAHRWIDGVVETYAYDGLGRLTQEAYADSATGVPQSRSLYQYNAAGLGTEELAQEWDGSAWANRRRYAVTYDAQGNLTEELHQEWVNGAWRTDDGYRYALTYNPAGVLTEQVAQRWRNGAFVNNGRLQYSVSAASQWTAVVHQLWSTGQWRNHERVTFVWHNWSRRQPASFEEQTWQGQWGPSARGTFAYAANDSYTLTTQEPAGAGAWANRSRHNYANDAQGNETAQIDEVWRNNAWQLDYGFRALLHYAAGGALEQRLRQVHDPSVSATYVNEELHRFSNFGPLAARVHVTAAAEAYPNPTAGPVRVRWNGPARGGEVLNALGQAVLTLALPAGATAHTLDLSRLPAGVYTLRLHAVDGATVTQRLVKQ